MIEIITNAICARMTARFGQLLGNKRNLYHFKEASVYFYRSTIHGNKPFYGDARTTSEEKLRSNPNPYVCFMWFDSASPLESDVNRDAQQHPVILSLPDFVRLLRPVPNARYNLYLRRNELVRTFPGEPRISLNCAPYRNFMES